MEEHSRPDDRPTPPDRLREAVRRFAADELDYRLTPIPGDETAELAAELNRMAESLERKREEIVRAVELYCLRRFGSVLIHDLKNLAARLNFVPDNLRGAGDEPEVIEACASTVEDTAERLMRLVRRFRDQREAMVLKIQGDINHVVRRALAQSGVLDAPDIRQEVELADLPPTILDAQYLEEAFTNLLRNAMEAMPIGGTIRVETRLRDERRPLLAEVRISDEGCGMTEEFIDRELYTPFRSTKSKGMGLGMFSCRETIELHGGRIHVDSEPGKGTTFRIHLPIRTEEGPK